MDTIAVRHYCAKYAVSSTATIAIDTHDLVSGGILFLGSRSNITSITVDGVAAINTGNEVWFLAHPTISASINVVVVSGPGGWGGTYLLGIYLFSYGDGFAGSASCAQWELPGAYCTAHCQAKIGGRSVGIGSAGTYAVDRGFYSGPSTNDYIDIGTDGIVNYNIQSKNDVSTAESEDYYWVHQYGTTPDDRFFVVAVGSVYSGTQIKAIDGDLYTTLKKVAGVSVLQIEKVGGLE